MTVDCNLILRQHIEQSQTIGFPEVRHLDVGIDVRLGQERVGESLRQSVSKTRRASAFPEVRRGGSATLLASRPTSLRRAMGAAGFSTRPSIRGRRSDDVVRQVKNRRAREPSVGEQEALATRLAFFFFPP